MVISLGLPPYQIERGRGGWELGMRIDKLYPHIFAHTCSRVRMTLIDQCSMSMDQHPSSVLSDVQKDIRWPHNYNPTCTFTANSGIWLHFSAWPCLINPPPHLPRLQPPRHPLRPVCTPNEPNRMTQVLLNTLHEYQIFGMDETCVSKGAVNGIAECQFIEGQHSEQFQKTS